MTERAVERQREGKEARGEAVSTLQDISPASPETSFLHAAALMHIIKHLAQLGPAGHHHLHKHTAEWGCWLWLVSFPTRPKQIFIMRVDSRGRNTAECRSSAFSVGAQARQNGRSRRHRWPKKRSVGTDRAEEIS